MASDEGGQELAAEVNELERLLVRWRHDRDPETVLRRRLVRRAIARRKARLKRLQEAKVLSKA